MADELADDSEALSLAHLLDGGGDIEEAAAGLALMDGGFERGLGGFEQLSGGRTDFTDGVGDGGVGVEAVDDDPAVDGEDVAFLEDALVARACRGRPRR